MQVIRYWLSPATLASVPKSSFSVRISAHEPPNTGCAVSEAFEVEFAAVTALTSRSTPASGFVCSLKCKRLDSGVALVRTGDHRSWGAHMFPGGSVRSPASRTVEGSVIILCDQLMCVTRSSQSDRSLKSTQRTQQRSRQRCGANPRHR